MSSIRRDSRAHRSVAKYMKTVHWRCIIIQRELASIPSLKVYILFSSYCRPINTGMGRNVANFIRRGPRGCQATIRSWHNNESGWAKARTARGRLHSRACHFQDIRGRFSSSCYSLYSNMFIVEINKYRTCCVKVSSVGGASGADGSKAGRSLISTSQNLIRQEYLLNPVRSKYFSEATLPTDAL